MSRTGEGGILAASVGWCCSSWPSLAVLVLLLPSRVRATVEVLTIGRLADGGCCAVVDAGAGDG